jgi:hypothetical protein
LQADLRRETERRFGTELHLGHTDGEPPVRRLRFDRSFERRPAPALDAPAQPGRRDDRREQHDDQQDRVLARLEHTAGKAERREHHADFTARDHPDADEQAVAVVRDHAGEQLAQGCDDAEGSDEDQRLRIADRCDARLRADEEEEHRHEEMRHRSQPPAEILLLLDAAEGDPGDERTDDRCEAGCLSEPSEREREGDRRADERALRPRLADEAVEDEGREP